VGNNHNELYGVAVASSDDVWAVGYYEDASRGGAYSTLILRWNGTSWNRVPSPNMGNSDNFLNGVAVASPNDVWAVGYYEDASRSGALSTLVMRWNGTSWNTVPSPNVGSNHNYLIGVAVASPNDVWAVGSYYDTSRGGGALSTLVMRWNGTSWSVVPSPNVGNNHNELYGVAVASSDDVWAVGYYLDTSRSGAYSTLILRWNGISWSVVPSPNVGTSSHNYLYSVAVTSSSDVWAVGFYYDTSRGGASSTLVMRWNGTNWNTVPSPNMGNSNNFLNGVAVASPSDVWVVGYYNDTSRGALSTLVMRWNGTSWNTVPSPNAGSNHNYLWGVAVASPSDVWVVGYYNDTSRSGALSTLTIRYTCTTATPTTTATNTPSAPSPTPTALVCPMNFTDVDEFNPFYIYIRCLYCRGIIGGYNDPVSCAGVGTPCFRPYNPTTRGQMAKIVSNAAGFSDPIPSNRQTFSDVPPGHTFWVYIERLAWRGIVGGYADGTFRPDNWVTRGQMTKFASNAAGFEEEVPPDTQTYTDVPPGSTFWVYIERLSGRGIVSGYECGNPEPCDPQRRPWYRPELDITRGQTSKIVANTFFPINCAPRGDE
jgi:hypothetical protein